jgi:hypothetical protein
MSSRWQNIGYHCCYHEIPASTRALQRASVGGCSNYSNCPSQFRIIYNLLIHTRDSLSRAISEIRPCEILPHCYDLGGRRDSLLIKG